uniref:Putative CyP450 monooxygenase n=1 Tax=Moniliophthora roreri TaxID=221103 RepID=A0A0W0FXD9_MONRR
MDVAGMSIIVLNSYEAATDLLERRSATYSSRPRFPMACEIVYIDAVWKARSPKSFHNLILPSIMPKESRRIEHFSTCYCNTQETGGTMFEILRVSVIISVTYGIDTKDKDNPYMKITERALEIIEEALSGGHLVVLFPSLKYNPFSSFKPKVKEGRKIYREMANIPFEKTKQDVKEGIAQPSFVSDALQRLSEEESDKLGYDEVTVKETAATVYQG